VPGRLFTDISLIEIPTMAFLEKYRQLYRANVAALRAKSKETAAGFLVRAWETVSTEVLESDSLQPASWQPALKICTKFIPPISDWRDGKFRKIEA
jgi:hypothetical protein